MASTAEATPTGCYKCGKTGHWSKDCPSTPGGTSANGGGASGGTAPSTARGFNRASGGTTPSTAGGFSGASGATGCYKCGKTGHWSRDCPFKPGGTPANGGGASGGSFSNSGGFNGGKSWSGKTADSNATWSKNVPKEPIKKEPRKRPKLTADLLLSEKGLGYVLEKMPEMVIIKGREETVVRDLKSLLEGYMHWHSLLLPYFSFDQFVEKLEGLGATKRVKMCTRELRDKIVYGKGSTGDEEVEAEAPGGSSPNRTLPEDTPGVSAGPGNELDEGIIPPDDIFTSCEPDLVNDDIFTNDEPGLPVNAEEFEDFFRQGVVEPSDSLIFSPVEGDNARPGVQGKASPVRKFPSLEDEASTVPPKTAASSVTISESAAARMEANRLRALELAKARRATNVDP